MLHDSQLLLHLFDLCEFRGDLFLLAVLLTEILFNLYLAASSLGSDLHQVMGVALRY